MEQPTRWSLDDLLRRPIEQSLEETFSNGGSEAPMKILTEAALDISSTDFWQGGFDVLENMIAELDQPS
jgi:oligoendopeptidase F